MSDWQLARIVPRRIWEAEHGQACNRAERADLLAGALIHVRPYAGPRRSSCPGKHYWVRTDDLERLAPDAITEYDTLVCEHQIWTD